MLIIVKVLCDLYTEPNEEGVTKLIKKNVEYLKQFETTRITIEQYVNPKTAKTIKKYCYIKEDDKYYKVNHKFEDLIKLNKAIEVKGFQFKTKK